MIPSNHKGVTPVKSNTTKRFVSFSFVLLLASLGGCTTQGPGNGNDNGNDNVNANENANANGNINDNGTDNTNTNDNGTDNTNTNDNGTDNANDNSSSDVACVTGAEATIECTPDTCTTSIGVDVPTFFGNYFRCVTITIEGDDIVIVSNGSPPHKSHYYNYDTPANETHPNFVAFDTSGSRSPNPNQIGNNALTIRFPLSPTSKDLTIDDSLVDAVSGSSPDEFPMGAAGIALDGVALFNSLAAPGDVIEDEAFTFDSYEAHPEQDGTYHYHSATPGPLEILEAQGILSAGDTTPGSAAVELYGIMCDGTVVMGCTELDGSTPSDADFDSQNGHRHDMVDTDGISQFVERVSTTSP